MSALSNWHWLATDVRRSRVLCIALKPSAITRNVCTALSSVEEFYLDEPGTQARLLVRLASVATTPLGPEFIVVVGVDGVFDRQRPHSVPGLGLADSLRHAIQVSAGYASFAITDDNSASSHSPVLLGARARRFERRLLLRCGMRARLYGIAPNPAVPRHLVPLTARATAAWVRALGTGTTGTTIRAAAYRLGGYRFFFPHRLTIALP